MIANGNTLAKGIILRRPLSFAPTKGTAPRRKEGSLKKIKPGNIGMDNRSIFLRESAPVEWMAFPAERLRMGLEEITGFGMKERDFASKGREPKRKRGFFYFL
jgi:hypothetical protein